MKKIFLSSTISLALVHSVFAQSEPKQTLLPPQKPKFVEEIVSQYDEGVYDSFLKQMDATYREENSKWQHDAIMEERKKKCAIVQSFKPVKDDLFATKAAVIRENEGRELVELCLCEPISALTRNVKEMIFFSPSEREQASLDYLDNLALKFKGEGETPMENKLINIDTEFWIKTVSLEVLLTKSKINQTSYIKQRAVLQLEKLKQMEIATQEQDADPIVKEHIKTALRIYPQVQVSCITRKYLHDLATGKLEPQNPTEEKIKQITSKYHDKMEALIKEYFPEDKKSDT